MQVLPMHAGPHILSSVAQVLIGRRSPHARPQATGVRRHLRHHPRGRHPGRHRVHGVVLRAALAGARDQRPPARAGAPAHRALQAPAVDGRRRQFMGHARPGKDRRQAGGDQALRLRRRQLRRIALHAALRSGRRAAAPGHRRRPDRVGQPRRRRHRSTQLLLPHPRRRRGAPARRRAAVHLCRQRLHARPTRATRCGRSWSTNRPADRWSDRSCRGPTG